MSCLDKIVHYKKSTVAIKQTSQSNELNINAVEVK